MRFLWFGRKRRADRKTQSQTVVVREPQEVFSVNEFVVVNSPLAGSKTTALTTEKIDSLILSLVSEVHTPADIAVQEFFQEKGAEKYLVTNFSHNPARGLGGRVSDESGKRMVLIGPAPVISRATTPLCSELSEVVSNNPNALLVAIDGIAYATYTVTSEFI